MLPPSLFASRSVVGANLFTALLYGPFTVMLTLIPFVMIRGAHCRRWWRAWPSFPCKC